MAKLSNPSNDHAALQAEIDRLRAQLQKKTQLSLRVSDKGALSLYGMGRFPVTLYREQWERILEHGDAIRAFITDNTHRLKLKDAVKMRRRKAPQIHEQTELSFSGDNSGDSAMLLAIPAAPRLPRAARAFFALGELLRRQKRKS